MKNLVFRQEGDTWTCDSKQIHKTENEEWVLTEDKEAFVGETIYDVLSHLNDSDFHATFRLSKGKCPECDGTNLNEDSTVCFDCQISDIVGG